ncbi:MAG TPA: hypothetical protein VJN88_11875 [Ktedonobacterales bacterium]|nr:hypothetical protein [Ktedonobacterales bacterium]
MRVTLRIFSALTILCMPIGVAFVIATGQTGGDMSPLILPGFGFIALGILCALATAIIGIVTSATQRQFAWLLAVIVATLIPLVGIPVVGMLSGQVSQDTRNALASTWAPALALGGPILVGLVVFIYSFRVRDSAPLGAPS